MQAIPLELKKAIAIGIGLFIAFIGLTNSGLVDPRRRHARRPGRVHDLAGDHHDRRNRHHARAACRAASREISSSGSSSQPSSRRSSTTRQTSTRRVSGTPAGRTTSLDAPNFSLVGEFSFGAFTTLPFIAAWPSRFTLFLADFFDTMGTLVGVGGRPATWTRAETCRRSASRCSWTQWRPRPAAAVSASSATTYIESASGVGVGGRTGLGQRRDRRAVLPVHVHRAADRHGAATGDRACADHRRLADDQRSHRDRGRGRSGRARRSAGDHSDDGAAPVDRRRQGRAATLAGIDFHDLALGFSAALMIMLMPFTFSITDGIAAGFIVYVVDSRIPGRLGARAPAHVGVGNRVRDLLRDPDHAAGVQLDLGAVDGTPLVAGARWSFRGKDAGSPRIDEIRGRLRTRPRGEQRAPVAQLVFRQPLLSPASSRAAATSAS